MNSQKDQTFKEFMKFASQSKGNMILSVILAILSVASEIVPYFAVSGIIIKLLNGTTDLNSLKYYVLAAVLGYSGKVLFKNLSTTFSHQAAFTILKNIRQQLTQKLTRQPLGDVLSTPSGELKTIIVDTVENMESPLAHLIPELTSNLLIPVFMFGFLLYLDYRIALISLITIPVSMIFYAILMKQFIKYHKTYIEANNNMNSVLVEYINGIETIKTFNNSTDSYGRYEIAVEKNHKAYINLFKGTLFSYSAVMYTMPSTLLFVLPAGMHFYKAGTLTPDTLIMCIILSFGLVTPIITAMHHTDGIAQLKTILNEVLKVLYAPEIERPEENSKLNHLQIEFDNVHFAYEKKEVLKGVSFKTIPNGMTAIVGASGSGKSTIAKLMMNFWDVKSGEIRLGNKNMKDLSFEQINELISYVAQDNFLFNISIKDNIKLGNKNATDEEVIEAAKKASCHKFIMSLENGYDTLAGDSGNRFSGGEKQRITLARAILKDSPIVILDEATAYSDAENEAVIQQSIDNLVKGKTIITIVHRLSTIVNADQILVVDNGKIIDSGTHKSLVGNSEYYRKMWEAHSNESGGIENV